MTLKQFIRRNRITAQTEWADDNPNMGGDMPSGSTHWKVKLIRRSENGRRQLTVPFSMGPAHSKEPTAEDVLECLASDSASIESAGSFEDWAADLGYDTDSRKAERTFKVCEKRAEKLRAFLGNSTEALLYEVES